MNKRQKRLLEDNFRIYKDGKNWDLERWTDGGVDMFINVDITKNIVEEFENYLNNFDMDEEIELLRQDKSYKETFTIRESVQDFEMWENQIKTIKNILKEIE